MTGLGTGTRETAQWESDLPPLGSQLSTKDYASWLFFWLGVTSLSPSSVAILLVGCQQVHLASKTRKPIIISEQVNQTQLHLQNDDQIRIAVLTIFILRKVESDTFP